MSYTTAETLPEPGDIISSEVNPLRWLVVAVVGRRMDVIDRKHPGDGVYRWDVDILGGRGWRLHKAAP